MFHRPHGALRLHRSGQSRAYLEVFIWMLIGLVVYIMVRFVLADIVRLARMPKPVQVAPITPPVAAVERWSPPDEARGR